MQLTGTGVWSAHMRYGDPGEIAAAAAELDELGYAAIWIPDVGGDVLGAVEVLLRGAPRIVAATGILNIWMHEPAEVAARRASWSDAWQRRFLLGLGVSHAPLIDHEHPGRYTKPYSKMVDYLDGLDASEVPYPVDARVLAALRPKMLGLARDRAAGVHPYFVPPEHVVRAREILGAGATIAVELAVVLDTDPSTAARDGAAPHRRLCRPAELHEQPARVRVRRRRLRRPGQRPARGRDRRVGRPRRDRSAERRRCATRGPTTCASR